MIICPEEFYSRVESGDLTIIEKKRYAVCMAAQSALGETPVFYRSQPQGTKAPAAFVRIAKLNCRRRLGGVIEGRILFELRYLAKSPHDDSECELAMERLLDVLRGDFSDKDEISAERTETGAKIEVTARLRWILQPDEDIGDIMRRMDLEKAIN